MFKQTILTTSVLAVASSVVAGPVPVRRSGAPVAARSSSIEIGGSSFGSSLIGAEPVMVWPMNNNVFDSSSITLSSFSSSHSFDHWGGLSSLSNFDSFFGAENFCGLSNEQSFESSITCEQSTSITLIQQQLAIIGEYAKRVILENVCDVEAQTIVFNQWLGGLTSFGEDIRHVSSRTVTFDSSIASFIGDVCDSDGSINLHDFGFSGSDIGSHSVTIEGCNWNEESSPAIVQSAFQDCQEASGFSLEPPTSSSISSLCGSDCSLSIPSVSTSSSCESSDCGSSIESLPPSCSGSDCGSSIESLPPSCSGSDCGSSVTELPPSCDGSDCGSSISSLPPSCNGSDCGSSISSLPPTSCDGSDCGSSISSLPPTCDGSDCGSSVDSSSSIDSGLSTISDGSVPLPTDTSASLSGGSTDSILQGSLATATATDASGAASTDASGASILQGTLATAGVDSAASAAATAADVGAVRRSRMMKRRL